MNRAVSRALGAIVLGLAALASIPCGSPPPGGTDLLAGRPALARRQRIADVVREALPAAPPSRHRFDAVVPWGGRLAVAAGIPARHQAGSGVEFVVKVRSRGRETTVSSQLVDPANRPAHRGWVLMDADLSRYGGTQVEILLETRGFETAGAPDRAFWGTPVITSPRGRQPPLVVVYLVDTLRADHLSAYGYPRRTAPELEGFARDGVVFEQAIASSSWTKPSVASLFTSLRPRDHGCVQFYTPLDPALVTMAERFREGGYATGAVVVNRLVLAKYAHFDQGFSYFAAPASPRRAGDVVDAALAFLDGRRGLPTFLYLHTMDSHTPYLPPPPFDRLFAPPPAPGRAAAEPSDYREPGDLDRIVAQYDGAVAYGDREFGRLLDGLKRRRRYENAMIVFLSDHGEELLDRGDWVHGHTLFDELVRVPLVVKYPGGRHAGQRVDRQVQLVDVMPTLLASAHLPVPAGIAGLPLAATMPGPRMERPAPFETKYREHVAYGARTESGKYIREFHPRDRERYFDLIRDPGETDGRRAAGEPSMQALKQAAESASGAAAFAHRLRAEGRSTYELRLRTNGAIERVDAAGLGKGESAEVRAGGRVASLRLVPRPGEPREVVVRTRPHGVALWLEGTRDGLRLRRHDVRVGGAGAPPGAVPFRLPDVERIDRPFAAPTAGRPGLSVWLVPTKHADAWEHDPQVAEDLKALGYVP